MDITSSLNLMGFDVTIETIDEIDELFEVKISHPSVEFVGVARDNTSKKDCIVKAMIDFIGKQI